MGLLKKLFGDYSTKEIKRVKPIMNAVLSLEEERFQATIDAGLKDEDFEVIFRVGDGTWEVLKDVILNEDGSITITIDREGVIAILVNSDDGSGNEPQPPQTSDPMFIILGVMAVAGVATVTVAKKRKA